MPFPVGPPRLRPSKVDVEFHQPRPSQKFDAGKVFIIHFLLCIYLRQGVCVPSSISASTVGKDANFNYTILMQKKSKIEYHKIFNSIY